MVWGHAMTCLWTGHFKVDSLAESAVPGFWPGF